MIERDEFLLAGAGKLTEDIFDRFDTHQKQRAEVLRLQERTEIFPGIKTFYLIFGAPLLAVALALRLTKVAGEIKNKKN